ncbi:16738_t:CDS:2, partial [Entrophospora sp. SA101]
PERKPIHPGETLRTEYLEPLSISVPELAQQLQVEEQIIQELLAEKANLTIIKPKEALNDETKKQCIACQELLDFLEPEVGKYLCGKVKCLRSYIAGKAKEKHE